MLKGDGLDDYKQETIDSFFRRNPDVGIEIMGEAKYKLYKSGEIKLRNFIDLKGGIVKSRPGGKFYTNKDLAKKLGFKLT